MAGCDINNDDASFKQDDIVELAERPFNGQFRVYIATLCPLSFSCYDLDFYTQDVLSRTWLERLKLWRSPRES